MAQERAGAVPAQGRRMTLRLGHWRMGLTAAGAVALTVIVALVALGSIFKLREDARWVAHTEEVIASLSEVLLLTVDTETAQRGFVFTGDTAYLQPYRRATRASLLALDKLRRLVVDNPLQSERAAKLAALTQQRIDQVDLMIDLRTTRGFEATRTSLLEGDGKQLQDRIRDLVAQMRAEEQQLLAGREARSATSAQLVQHPVNSFLI